MGKFLVIGYGSIGKRHAAILREMGHDVLACDPYSEEANDRGAFAWFDEDDDFAGVLLCTHPQERAIVIGQMGRGWKQRQHWFVEKPIHFLPKMPEETMAGFCYRWCAELAAFRAELEKCRIYHLSLVAGQPLQAWHETDYRNRYHGTVGRGGVINDSLSHVLYVARWLAGELDVVGAHHGHLSGLDVQTEDVAAALLVSENNVPVYACVDYLRDPREFRIEAVTSEGIKSWIFDYTRADVMYRRQMEVFVEVCDGKRQYGYPTWQDGLAVEQLCEKVRKWQI